MTINVVSFSEVFKWDTCPRQYYYSFILGLRSEEGSGPMMIGYWGHKLLQFFYEGMQAGKTKEESWEITKSKATKILNEERVGDFSILTAWTLVDNYIRADEFRANAVLVENRFLFPASQLSDDPIFSEIQIGFTPDVVFERTGGFLDVEDYKFVERAWSKSKLNRYQQAKLYQIFLKIMGYNISKSTLRFFNPKTGKVTFQDYILDAEEEATLIHDFLEATKEIIAYKARSPEELAATRRTMNYTLCGNCDFEFPCTLQAEGKDASKTLKHLFVKSNYDYTQ